jgi:hypothetical protein
MTEDERMWLEVPFADKDAAKAAGARWDWAMRAWYAPRTGMTELQRWVGRPPLPDLLPGEDRSFGAGLFVDLIPDSCWFTNVRSCVDERDWDRIKRTVRRRARDRCEACGARRDPAVWRWLEAHERWQYDTATRTQRLRRLVCLCSFCHEVTHFGFAAINGHEDRGLRHLMYVNGWSGTQAKRHVDAAFATWEKRCKLDWTLDLAILLNAGITVTEQPDPHERRRIGRG